MKLTRTHLTVGVGVLVLLGIVSYFLAKRPTPNTPIIIVGGSIKAKTWHTDSDGWTLNGQIYTASLHATSSVNPAGIDYLILYNFVEAPPPASPPPNPLTVKGTGGWAVSVSNLGPDGVSPKPNALKLCSDQTCSASTTLIDGSQNPSRCSQTLNSAGPVYFGALRQDDSLYQQMAGSVIRELHFHDKDKNCGYTGGDNDSKCDEIASTIVETCNPSLGTFTCNAGKSCQVKIGKEY